MSSARISARPAAQAAASCAAGNSSNSITGTEIRKLGLRQGSRDGSILVPSSCNLKQPIPLILMLHGAGGTSRGVISMLSKHAEQHRVMVVAPESVRSSWDMISGPGFGPDVIFINKVLSHIFENYPVDPHKVAVAGFSDGTSYALSLGLANGDLFPYILAFSPGFMRVPNRVGSPRIFISHGSNDNVLPVECGRRLARELKRDDYGGLVDYREFQGGHVVPLHIVGEAMKFFNVFLKSI